MSVDKCIGCGWPLVTSGAVIRCPNPGCCSKSLKSRSSIDHPPHYTFGTIEPIDVFEDWGLSYPEATALKYVVRAGRKGPALEDYLKAEFFMKRLPEHNKGIVRGACRWSPADVTDDWDLGVLRTTFINCLFDGDYPPCRAVLRALIVDAEARWSP